MKQIKNFLLSFDGRLDRKSFAVLVLPCLLFLVFIGLVAIMALARILPSFYSFDWVLVLSFLPLFLFGACLFLLFLALDYIPLWLEECGVGEVSLNGWELIDIFGLILLPASVISYLLCLLIIKRLNDLNRSRKWVLLIFVPFVNWIFLAYLLRPSKKDKMKQNKIIKFLGSFDGRLDRKSFAFLFLPCFLILILFVSLSMWFSEPNPLLLNFFDFFFVLAFLPLLALTLLWASLFSLIPLSNNIPLVFTVGIFKGLNWGGAYFEWARRFILILIWSIFLLSYPFCLLTAKRLNDLNRSRKWILLIFVPFVNWLFLAYLLLKDSKKNKI